MIATPVNGYAFDMTTTTDPRVGAVPDAQQIDHPGTTDELTPRPDHGEQTYRGSGRLTGRRALVTGGDSGIGRAVAIAFAREGADVAFTHLAEEGTDASATSGLVHDAGRRSVAIEADLRTRDACRTAVERTVAELGGVDIVVCNAAYQMALDSIADLTEEQLRRTFETNVFHTVWTIQAALDHLQPGSSIIVTSSIQATSPSPELFDYAATKGALTNIVKSASNELAERGIRVNAVAPGPVWTPLIPATMPPEKVDGFGEDTPLGRPAQPAELAPAYVFLASDDSTYITGESIAVTGGRLTPG